MRFRLFIIFLSCGFTQFSQPLRYIFPLDSPWVLSGNYGELRPNHFHAGLDFSTGGNVNLPVYAAEEGYVSRIRVSPVGYGKCVYITHPGGHVTVYAHLNAFAMKLDGVVKLEQYARRKYEIDFIPRTHSIRVKKNEIIGLSGNTGGSTGPHLHFEIRDEISETPLNPLKFLKTSDHVKPVLNQLAIFSLSDTTSPVYLMNCRLKRTGDSVVLQNDHITLNQAIVGLAFSGFDRFTATGSVNNIYSVKMFFDGKLSYSHFLDNIHFDNSRYVNEFSQKIGKQTYQRCFLPTMYPEKMYEHVVNKGRILLADTSYHTIRLLFTDETGNQSSIQFWLKTKKFNFYHAFSVKGNEFVNCVTAATIDQGELTLRIPAGSLYNSTSISVVDLTEKLGKFSIKPGKTNLNNAVGVTIRTNGKFKQYASKLILTGGGGLSIGTISADSVRFTIKSFGDFQMLIDTIRPRIKLKPLSTRVTDAWKHDSFSFTISDDLSGVGRYDVYINNVWVLAEYDSKFDTLTYFFDENTPIGLLQFRVEVEDRVGNRETFFYLLKK
jgi:hypothetical protein